MQKVCLLVLASYARVKLNDDLGTAITKALDAGFDGFKDIQKCTADDLERVLDLVCCNLQIEY